MATGNEKRLPVLQAIVSISVKPKFASCGEREANVVFLLHLVPSSIAPHRRMFTFAWSSMNFSFFFFHHFRVCEHHHIVKYLK